MSAVVTISIDLTSPNLTDQDKAVLAALGLTPGGVPGSTAGATTVVVSAEQAARQFQATLDEINEHLAGSPAPADEKPAPKLENAAGSSIVVDGSPEADSATAPAVDAKPAPKPRRSRAKKAETEEAPSASGPAALEDLPTATRSEAIEWAIKLSDKGLKAELRDILDKIGAERASTITDGEQAAQFISLTKSVLASQPAAPAEEAPAEEAPAEEAPAGRTLQDAIDAAMALVKDNKGAVVRAAVKSLGVAKVSAMTEDQVPEFFRLIEG